MQELKGVIIMTSFVNRGECGAMLIRIRQASYEKGMNLQCQGL